MTYPARRKHQAVGFFITLIPIFGITCHVEKREAILRNVRREIEKTHVETQF